MSHKQLFENFISEHLDHIYRFAYGYMQSREDAEDAINDSVVKALKSLNNLRTPQYLSTWFYRILINTCNTTLKRSAKVIPIDPHSADAEKRFESASMNGYDWPEDVLELQCSFDDLIAPLSPEHRAVIILRYLEDKPLSEVAEILDINLNTVKTRLYRALDQLRNQHLIPNH